MSLVRACDTCGSEFRFYASDVTKAAKRGCSPPRYCSRACRDVAYRGAGNPKWRGGRLTTAQGYIYALAPDHPHATKSGYVMEHRLVMEHSLGRFLDPTEEVHHRNHVRDDNRIENLEVMSSTAEHRIHHAYYVEEGCACCGAPVQRSAAHRRRWSRAFCSRQCAASVASRAAAEKAAS